MLSTVNVVLWFYDQDMPVEWVSSIFFSVGHATERSVKREMHDFFNFVLGLFDNLGTR